MDNQNRGDWYLQFYIIKAALDEVGQGNRDRLKGWLKAAALLALGAFLFVAVLEFGADLGEKSRADVIFPAGSNTSRQAMIHHVSTSNEEAIVLETGGQAGVGLSSACLPETERPGAWAPIYTGCLIWRPGVSSP